MARAAALALSVLMVFAGADAHAQDFSDRIIPPGPGGSTLFTDSLNIGIVGRISSLARVPIGIETLPAPRSPAPPANPDVAITLTGRTVREAMNALVRLDPRYEWRDLDGVPTIRPKVSWGRADDPLSLLMRAVDVDAARAGDALRLAGQGFGTPDDRSSGPADTRSFAIHTPAGTVLDFLTAVARAHGELCWQFSWNPPPPQGAFNEYPAMLMFHIAGSGTGIGIRQPK
jgi:hypothetical protein